MKNMFVTILTLLLFTSCATKTLVSKVSDAKLDTFREESFLRYTEERLKGLEKTPYQALAKCYSGNIQEGLDLLRDQMKEQKKKPEYWNQVGMCYFLKDNFTKAEYFFDLSLAQAPGGRFEPAINNLGVLKLKLRHYEEALNFFKKASGKRETHKVPLFNQAQVYLQFNLLDQAAPILERLASINDKSGVHDPDLTFSLGSVYLLKGQIEKAFAIFNSIPDKYKNREDVTLVRAISLYEQGKYYEAKEVLENKNFLEYVPLKKSAQKLALLVQEKIKAIEAAQKEKS
jgi:tetratricopeptide (TPR) repeat protein